MDDLPHNLSQTIRQSMRDLLSGEDALSARDLSRLLGIREKVVYEHLVHIRRSVSSRGKTLKILPATCQSCGYVFEDRKRFTRPGRCPACRATRIEAPLYRIG